LNFRPALRVIISCTARVRGIPISFAVVWAHRCCIARDASHDGSNAARRSERGRTARIIDGFTVDQVIGDFAHCVRACCAYGPNIAIPTSTPPLRIRPKSRGAMCATNARLAPVAAMMARQIQHLSASARAYLSCMSFLTDLTPSTALATLIADLISSRELTKPLS